MRPAGLRQSTFPGGRWGAIWIAVALAAAGAAMVIGARERRRASASATTALAPPVAVTAINDALDALVALPALAAGSVGFYLAPLDEPANPLLARHAKRSFTPASTLKLITTGVALYELGPDFRFETSLRHEGGNLIVRGGGDPSLGRGGWAGLFDGWLEALHAAGIHEISGRVIADEEAWDPPEIPDDWTWGDIGNYYAPPLSALSFHDNQFRLFFRVGAEVGERAEFVDADPWPPGVRFIDEMRTGPPGSGDNGSVFGAPGDDRQVLRGTLPAGEGTFVIRGAFPDPALFCATELTTWLRRRDVPVHGQPVTSRQLREAGRPLAPPSSGTRPIAVHRSPPLGELLVPINRRSLNLDCECLLRTLGGGRAGDGLARIRRNLGAHKWPLVGFEQSDGSGLSRTNRVTPELLARACAGFATGRHGATFIESFPVRGSIRFKPGSIGRVKCHAGIVSAASGRSFVFAIAVNGWDGESAPVSAGVEGLFEAMSAL